MKGSEGARKVTIRVGRRVLNGPPRVVTGTCLLSRVLAYSNDRSEEELIVDPKDVRDMRNIKVIAKAHCHIAAEPLDELLKSKQHRRSDYVNIS